METRQALPKPPAEAPDGWRRLAARLQLLAFEDMVRAHKALQAFDEGARHVGIGSGQFLRSRRYAQKMLDESAAFLVSPENPWNALSNVSADVIEEQVEAIKRGDYPGTLGNVTIKPEGPSDE